jgi:hypothetical protein
MLTPKCSFCLQSRVGAKKTKNKIVATETRTPNKLTNKKFRITAIAFTVRQFLSPPKSKIEANRHLPQILRRYRLITENNGPTMLARIGVMKA